MKKFFVLFIALTMLLCLGACGSGKDSNDNDKDEDSEVINEFEKDEDKSKQKIVVGYTIYEPMNYIENGELVGFDTELAQAVFSNLGYEFEFKEIEWSYKYTELDSGSIDCVWNGFVSNATENDGTPRTELVDFSYDYIENCQLVVVKKGSDINTVSDLAGKYGCVESGSMGEWYADVLGVENVDRLVEKQDCFLKVKYGEVDFAILDSQSAISCVGKGEYEDLEIVEALSSEAEYYAIAFKKGSDLTVEVNEQLEALAKDGTMIQLAEKYGLTGSVITDFSSQK